MKWKYLLILYVVVVAVGIGVLFLFPSPAIAEVIGGLWSFVTFGLLVLFMVQKAVHFLYWVKAKRHR